MKKVTYVCDKCSKDTSLPYCHITKIEANFLLDPITVEIDLCDTCYKIVEPHNIKPEVIKNLIKKLFI